MGQTDRPVPGNSVVRLSAARNVQAPDFPRNACGEGGGEASDSRDPCGWGSPARGGAEVRASRAAQAPQASQAGVAPTRGAHGPLARTRTSGLRRGRHFSFQGFSLGLSEEIIGLSLGFQRKHLVKTSKPKEMLLALLGLLTELLTDSASVHKGRPCACA